jgi:integrase
MPREEIPHVKRVVAKGNVYLYFNTGKKKANGAVIYAPLPSLKDPAFWPRHAALCAGRTKRANVASVLTVPMLVDLYRKSPQWADHAPNTRKLYDQGLNKAAQLLSIAPANEVCPSDIREHMDDLWQTPSMANAYMRTIGALYHWARSRAGLKIGAEPIKGLQPYKGGEHKPWPPELLQLALTDDDALVRLSVHMMYFWAARIGDVSKARWSDIKDGYWTFTPEKTKDSRGEMKIPLHKDLIAELARHAKVGPFLFTGKSGPTSRGHLRVYVQEWAAGKGFKIVPHGLRKNAVIALLDAECSVAETASISGQSLQMVEYYARQRDQTKLGSAAILKWEKRA